MAANMLGFDYGGTVRNAESIKTARLQRESAALDVDAKRSALSERNNMLSLRRSAAGGDKAAATELAVIDPEGAERFRAALGGLTEEERAATRQGVELMGRMAAFVKTSDDPAAAYQVVLGQLPEGMAGQVPQEYNPQFVDLMLARATEYDRLLDEVYGEAKEERAADRSAAAAKEEEAAAIRADERKHNYAVKMEKVKSDMERAATGGQRALKSADSNTIIRAAAPYFEGIIDQNGDVRLLDPAQGAKFNELASLASEIYASSNVPHVTAVRMAADRLGLNAETPAPAPQGKADPLGLFSGG